MSNVIQVFGLPRSGTNAVEWLLRNNLDINYQNIMSIGNVKGIRRFSIENALKHNYPTLDNSNYAIVVYKSPDRWVESYIKEYGSKNAYFKLSKVWKRYYGLALNEAILNPNKIVLVNFTTLVLRSEEFIRHISNKWQLDMIEPFTKLPVNRLTKTSGKGTEKKPYTLLTCNIDKISDSLLEKSWR